MIEPGKITLELIMNNPALYMAWIYIAPLALAGLAAYFADRVVDERLRAEARSSAGTPPREMGDMFEFEHVTDPVAWGMLACIVLVFPLADKLDVIGGWTAIWSSAVLAGLVSRAALMRLASGFLSKIKKE